MQKFTIDEQHLIAKGATRQSQLVDLIDTALHDNIFDDSYIIGTVPGVGKTYTMKEAIKKMPKEDRPLLIEGSAGLTMFTIEVATAAWLAQGKPIVVVLDDCDVLFEDKSLNTAKKMFDETQELKYNKMARGLKHFCSDLQWQAIESFSTEESAGFSVNLKNVTFVILSNRSLASANMADAAEDGSTKQTRFTDQYAIRRRTQYEHMNMTNDELWGYAAHITLNGSICEEINPTITLEEKHDMLHFCRSNWNNMTERNLSIIEKMTKILFRYPDTARDMWTNKFVERS
jgi:hypothetical protein